MHHVWVVVGGEDRGGVLVRDGPSLSSSKLCDRLSTGALIQELELLQEPVAGERLHYRRLSGTGPEEGWISVALNHKVLAQRVAYGDDAPEEVPRDPEQDAQRSAPEAAQCTVTERWAETDGAAQGAGHAATVGAELGTNLELPAEQPKPAVRDGAARGAGHAAQAGTELGTTWELSCALQGARALDSEWVDAGRARTSEADNERQLPEPEAEYAARDGEHARAEAAEEPVTRTQAADEPGAKHSTGSQAANEPAGLGFDGVRQTLLDLSARSATLAERCRAIASADIVVWLVVGGEGKGGVLVREGLELSSPKEPERLSTGAFIQELELAGERLRYRKLMGSGPKEGWISVALDHKELAELITGGDKRAEAEAEAEAEARREARLEARRQEEEAARQKAAEVMEWLAKEKADQREAEEAEKQAEAARCKAADLERRVEEVRRIVKEAKSKLCRSLDDHRYRPRRAPPRRSGGRAGSRYLASVPSLPCHDSVLRCVDEQALCAGVDGEWECLCDMHKTGVLVKLTMYIQGADGQYFADGRGKHVNKLSDIALLRDEASVIVNFRWSSWNGLAGQGFWRLNEQGNHLDGCWSQEGKHGGPWKWVCARADAAVALLPSRAPVWYVIRAKPAGVQQQQLEGTDAVVEALAETREELCEFVAQARTMSRAADPKRAFNMRDLVGGRHLALLVDHASASTLGYCIYVVVGRLEFQIENLIISDPHRGRGAGTVLLEWAAAEAAAAECRAVTMRGSSSNLDFLELQGLRPTVTAPLGLQDVDPNLPASFALACAAELREAFEPDSALQCCLPAGTPVEVVPGMPARRGHQELVRLRWPVPGWLSADLLRPVDAEEPPEEAAELGAQLLETMQRVRSTVTGPDPFSMCFISSQALLDELSDRRIFADGWCKVVFGTFRRSEAGSVWSPHTWLALGDGSIADITADQFDQVPRLWWPADASRYRPDP